MKIKSILFLFFTIISYSVFAQYNPQIDSIIEYTKTQAQDSLKVNNLNTLSKKLRRTDFDQAVAFANEAYDLAEKIEFRNGQALAKKNLGDIHYLNNKYADAYGYYNLSLEIYEEIKGMVGKSKVVGNLGSIFHQQGEYDKALDYFYQSIEIRQQLGDTLGVAKLYNRVGLVFFQQGETSYKQALDYYEKALKIFELFDNKTGISGSYNRISSVYSSYTEPKYEKALYYSLEVVKLNEQNVDLKTLAQANQAIGLIYFRMGEQKKSLEYYLETVELWEELNNSFGISSTYNSIATYYLASNEFKKAEKYSIEALEIAKKNSTPLIAMTSCENLTIIYENQNKMSKALKFNKLYFALKDSLQSENMANAITKLSVTNQFNSQLKEQELKHEKDEIAHKAKQKRARILIFVFLGGLILMFIFAIYIFKNLRDKQKANQVLEEKNEEINQQNEEIIAQNEEIIKHRNEIVHQRDEIVASINYAKKIQRAVLPGDDEIHEILDNYFVLFKPRDIVSGDFFWIKKINNYIIVVAADCTGHGVPGAFMSMLGTSFLNETVTNRNLDNPAMILNKMRKRVKKALGQKGASGEQKDGMDLALYIINEETNILQFSGAYNPLYIIRNKVTEELKSKFEKNKRIKLTNLNKQDELTLIELKADKQPIGIYIREKDFTNTAFQLLKGDKLYTFSDGFVDQFGGEKGRKYKTKNFKNLLLSNYQKTMVEQKAILKKTFTEWISHYKANGKQYVQIDDIIIIGIEVSNVVDRNRLMGSEIGNFNMFIDNIVEASIPKTDNEITKKRKGKTKKKK